MFFNYDKEKTIQNKNLHQIAILWLRWCNWCRCGVLSSTPAASLPPCRPPWPTCCLCPSWSGRWVTTKSTLVWFSSQKATPKKTSPSEATSSLSSFPAAFCSLVNLIATKKLAFHISSFCSWAEHYCTVDFQLLPRLLRNDQLLHLPRRFRPTSRLETNV